MGAKLPPTHRRLFGMRNPFARAIGLALTILLLIAFTYRDDGIDMSAHLLKSHKAKMVTPQRPLGGTPANKMLAGNHTLSPVEQNCNLDATRLKDIQQKYGLDEKFQYLKRYVRFVRTPGLQRKRLTTVAQEFLPKKWKTVSVAKSYSEETCPEPLEVPVPASASPPTANASDFMFAVSTTYKRFSDPRTSSADEWAYWLTDGRGASNGGKLLLMLLDATDAELHETSDRLRGMGVDVDVYRSDASDEMAVRYLTLVPTMYRHAERPGRKWLVTCDDDTFFPSMHGLVDRLSQLDAEQPLYVGTLSEDIGAIDRHGSQAFGGAGVFLSVPLAAKLTKAYDSCRTPEKIREADSGWGPQGDILLRKCIYENTEVRLTTVWDLWQLDMIGDPAGFYESGLLPLSVHHFKGGGWHTAHPLAAAQTAYACGEDCTFLRVRTADDFVISSGYSVAHYPRGIEFSMDQMERTFSPVPEDKGWNFDFMFGPQRKGLSGTGNKLAWEMQEAVFEADGSVRQVYTRRKDDWRWAEGGKALSKLDGVIELVWIP